ncbi:VWFA and cache domain-containing protein 1-like isoform X2 [Clavelina lepadiformis]|uniref:VWFA and cache domain-containing protein 1-like isoform X2 n=1 Tax=Clavelina lepadiformis TaxID=159417 RepID=UPI004040EE67
MNTMKREVGLLIYFVTLALTKTIVDPDVRILSEYIGNLMNRTLGVETIQNEVNHLHFQREFINGSKVADMLSETISKSVRSHIDAVRKLRKMVEDHLSEVNARWTACCQYDESDVKPDKNYKAKVDLNEVCGIVAPNAPGDLEPLSNAVLDVMRENRVNVPEIKWQYVATVQGYMAIYPAHKTPSCAFIDPRYRPWFIETASSVRKNVLILLDISGSMNKKYNSVPLINISLEAVSIILETLNPDDKLGVIAFNNRPHRPTGCFEKNMALATETNLSNLKAEFLQHLIPTGESVYAVGFENAFQLLELSIAKSNNSHAEDWKIILITDGRPKETNRITDVYSVIKEGNRRIGNRASIYVYGLGRNANMSILQAIASQSFSRTSATSSPPPQGFAYHVEEQSFLPNYISSLNEYYVRTSDDITPTFSVPYSDGGGLGLIFTVGLPILRPDNALYAVTAVDISVADFFQNSLFFDSNGASYFFIIDGTGRVMSHPLLPQPADHSDVPNFVQIDQLERHNGFDEIMNSMTSGGRGQKGLKIKKTLPIGYAVQEVDVEVTYFWRPIAAAVNFSLCFVLETNRFNVTLNPQDATFPGKPRTSFRYHRLDLGSNEDTCRHFYKKSTKSQSLVLFAPRSFVSPFRYVPEQETTSTVTSYFNMFEQVMKATSTSQVTDILRSHQSTADLFVDGVVSDVMWTSLVDRLWVNNTDDHIAQRFIATRTGVDRLYPGTTIDGEFDATQRIWYELAVANPDSCVTSPPYQDASGLGNVVSMSQAIKAPTTDDKSTIPTVLGVMGVDFSLDFLFAKVREIYPNCWSKDNGWSCMLVDNRGNIILHKDYSNKGVLEVKHIAGNKQLIGVLKNRKMAAQRRCLDLDKKVYRVSYEIKPNSYLNETYSGNVDICTQYFMAPVPHTNIFFVARPEPGYCVDSGCPPSNQTCLNNAGSSSDGAWDCPCTQPIEIDNCANAIDLDDGVVPCYPDRQKISSNDDDCIPEHLNSCFNRNCKQAVNGSACTAMVGCSWCERDRSSTLLTTPYCSISEECYNGEEGQRLPGYEASAVCPVSVNAIDTVHLVLILVFGCIVLIILLSAIICLVKRRQRRNKEKEMSIDEEGQSTTSPFGPLSSPSSDGVESPTSLKNKGNLSPRKHSRAPQVIISVVDKDGSEILKKPVVLVQGGVTYGAPAPGVSATDLQRAKKRANSTPLIGRAFRKDRKLGDTSSTSSNNESGIHSGEENGKSCQSSGISDSSNNLSTPFTRSRQRRSRSEDIRRLPLEIRRLQQHQSPIKRAHPVSKRPNQVLDKMDGTSPKKDNFIHFDFPDSSLDYVPMRSASHSNIADDATVTKPSIHLPPEGRRRSADDILKPISPVVKATFSPALDLTSTNYSKSHLHGAHTQTHLRGPHLEGDGESSRTNYANIFHGMSSYENHSPSVPQSSSSNLGQAKKEKQFQIYV